MTVADAQELLDSWQLRAFDGQLQQVNRTLWRPVRPPSGWPGYRRRRPLMQSSGRPGSRRP
ncbi:hypothetical protein [Streptomyces sp. CoH27]|uniref:hypothetical protein n=1 Tax=Streptomyces sp. CoH27 TaxID=2875763 RepID=UPI001CD71281|nr:hypothetical protein [Streptomyces sp. CoH27]